MIPITAYKGKNIAVLGLGRSGISAALALVAGGATVKCWDDNDMSRRHAASQGLAIANLNSMDWQIFDALVLSPGIAHQFPRPHRVVHLAQQIGVPIIGDIELFAMAINSVAPETRPTVIGVTGTNGKSTVVSLIGHILRQAGIDARIGGNIGTAVLDMEPLNARSVYVLELSSYQLELVNSLRCNIAVHLNISPDHLERYADLDHYAASKERIFLNQSSQDWAIIGTDDDYMRILCTRMMGRRSRNISRISASMALPGGVSASGGVLCDDAFTPGRLLRNLNADRCLQGQHNQQNAAAAYAACRALGLEAQRVFEGMSSFAGLPHRTESLGDIDGVFFVNDSKATNVDATAHALASCRGARWIVGGRAKKGGLEQLRQLMGSVSKAYLIGESAQEFSAVMADSVEHVICGTIERAVQAAFADARRSGKDDEVILLSPACASFDQYPDFEARGEDFRRAVRSLRGRSAAVA